MMIIALWISLALNLALFLCALSYSTQLDREKLVNGFLRRRVDGMKKAQRQSVTGVAEKYAKKNL